MTFCANNPDHRGPFVQRPIGRNDALLTICVSCDEDKPVAWDRDRGYDVPDRHRIGITVRAFAAATNRVTGDTAETHRKRERGRTTAVSASPGFIVVLVPRQRRDRTWCDAAEARLSQSEPWFRELRHLGSDRRWHIFERPDVEAMHAVRSKNNHDPLAALAEMSKQAQGPRKMR